MRNNVTVFLLLLCCAFSLFAQEQYSKEELLSKLKTNQAKLNLEQAKTEMERAKADYDEIKQLFDAKVVTITEFNKAQKDYERATLNYNQTKIDLERTRLDLLQNATLVTLLDAKKYRADDGRIMVSVRLRNDSDLGKAKVAMGDEQRMSEEELVSLLTIDNLIVSLRGTSQLSSDPNDQSRSANATVGDPYQQVISKFKLKQEKTLEYELLKKDVEDVTIVLDFMGRKQEVAVFLKKESSQDLPSINSNQYAQQGQLGSKIRYDLTLERLAKTESNFPLVVLNLPKEIPFAFMDPKTGAQITNLKFDEQISKQTLEFELSIPQKLDQSFIDKSIEFTIVVCTQPELAKIYEVKKRIGNNLISTEEMAKIGGNKVQLVLIPKGSGKLEIIIPNLYKEVKKGQSIAVKFTALNAGTMALRKITPKIDFPAEWEGAIEPKEIEIIEPAAKAVFTITVDLPGDVDIGEYNIKMGIVGYAGAEVIEALEKVLTIHISAESNIGGTMIIVLILIAAVVAIAVASVKISRR